MASAEENLRALMTELAGACWEAAHMGASKEATVASASKAADKLLEKIEFARSNQTVT